MSATPSTDVVLRRLLQQEHELKLAELGVRRSLLAAEHLREALADPDVSEGRASLAAFLIGRGRVGTSAWQSLEEELARHEFAGGPSRPASKVPPEVEARQTDPAQVWAEFVLVSPLGQGGAAEVWKAWDRELGRWVALKIPRTVASSRVALERFRREMHAAARLAHPNIVPVHRVGEERGRPYIVMPFVEGRTLAEARLPLPEALRVMRTVAQAIHYAHQQGLVHRDLKPANVMLDGRGGVWVLDFGLVYLREGEREGLTVSGTILGTPAYMSPEQARGGAGARETPTDVYSLGATLYELVTGVPPFGGKELADVVRRVRDEDPVPVRRLRPEVDADVETILQKAMDKDPRRRYASAAEFAEDLRRRIDGEPIVARSAGPGYRLYRRLRRNPQGYGLGVGVAAAALAALAFWLIGRGEREQALSTMREQARLSLGAALELRRAGANERMRQFLPPLESAYRNAASRSPDLAEVDCLMGRMYRALLEDKTALEYQERALRKDPRFAPALYERAVLLSRLYGGELWKAAAVGGSESGKGLTERILRDCLDLEQLLAEKRGTSGPLRLSDANVLAARGILAYYRDETRAAVEMLRKSVLQDPLMEEAWEALAAAGVRLAQRSPAREERERWWREAEEAFTQGLVHDRGYLPHILGRSGMRNARAYFWRLRGLDPRAELAAAEEDLARVLSLDPKNAGAWMQRGDLRSNRSYYLVKRGLDPSEDFAAAEDFYAKALEVDPNHGSSFAWRGHLRWSRGEWRSERGGDPAPDFALAEEDLTAALRISSKDYTARAWRGYVQLSRGTLRRERGEDPSADFAEAERYFREAVQIESKSHTSWTGRGLTATQKGLRAAGRGVDPLPDFRAAEEFLSHVLDLDPDYVRAWTGRGLVRAHRALHRKARGEDPAADWEAAEKDLARAVEIDREHAEGWAELGRVRQRRSLHAQAVRDYQEAIRLNPLLEPRVREALKAAKEKAAER